ncbi:MAG: sigma-70 family RNA polymerase sigma factor [Ruminococcus sp.]|nr:sigma-70 family RNA polymerase sigma factor [Ruminococcus sp.]
MDDPSIIDLYWERSEEAIAQTDIKYKKLCMHVADNILLDHSDSEECLSDTYLAAWKAMPSQRPKYLPAFLCRIIRNFALKRCEYNTAQKRNPEVALSLDELDDTIPSPDNVESSVDAAELGRIISAFLRKQGRKKRSIFLRRYWYYDSVSTIAEKYSMSEESVRQMLFRLRRKLKEYLEKEGL